MGKGMGRASIQMDGDSEVTVRWGVYRRLRSGAPREVVPGTPGSIDSLVAASPALHVEPSKPTWQLCQTDLVIDRRSDPALSLSVSLVFPTESQALHALADHLLEVSQPDRFEWSVAELDIRAEIR